MRNDLPPRSTGAVRTRLLSVIGVAVVGVVWLGEDWNWLTVTSLAMIIIGVVALNLSGAH